MSILIFFIILFILVLVHELGHFAAAKFFGIRVDEFGFGFPPKLFGKKYGETEYTLNALPFGGFVKIFGEDPNDENISGPDAERSFVHKAKWKQAIVLFAGIFMNFLLAWLLVSGSFLFGISTSIDSQVAGYPLNDVHLVVVSVLDKSPAEIAGLKAGDKIISVTTDKDTLSPINPDTLKAFVVSHGDAKIQIGYIRGKDNSPLNTTTMTPQTTDTGPIIGISMDEVGTQKLSFFRSLWEGLKLTLSLAKSTFSGLYGLIRDAVEGHGSLATVTGPVGLVGIVGDAYKLGFSYLVSFTSLISINLAVVNLIPFPALDGGRIFFLLIEKIKGSRINPKVVNMVNTVGFVILILFMLLVTYHDVAKLL